MDLPDSKFPYQSGSQCCVYSSSPEDFLDVRHGTLGLRAAVRMGKREAKPGVLGSPNLFYPGYLQFFSVLYIVFCLLLLLLLLSRFSRVWLCATPETAAHQAPPSLGFSRQENWSGLPFPSPMHESEK